MLSSENLKHFIKNLDKSFDKEIKKVAKINVLKILNTNSKIKEMLWKL